MRTKYAVSWRASEGRLLRKITLFLSHWECNHSIFTSYILCLSHLNLHYVFYSFPSLTDSHFHLIPVHGPWQNAWHCDICIVYSKCLKHLSTSTWSCSLRSLFVQILSVVERAAICIERCTGAVHGADKLGQPGAVLGAENNADSSVTINAYVYCILCIVAV